MSKILVSACLLGLPCRYDGKEKPCLKLQQLNDTATLIPFCPECMGGLPTPRTPAERVGDRVLTEDGRDVTAEYRRGAEQVLALARRMGCTAALLKERSPACGSGEIYDGSFTRILTAGDGVTAELLKQNGIAVFGESQLDALNDYLAREECR